MGYRPKRKTWKLVFADEDMAGLEVAMRSVSVDSMIELAELQAAAAGGSLDGAGARKLFAGFAAALDSWNVEDEDGSPVPPTLDGVKAQDLDFVMAIVAAWFEAVTSVDPPSAAGSSSGGTLAEASLPMAPLSPGRPS